MAGPTSGEDWGRAAAMQRFIQVWGQAMAKANGAQSDAPQREDSAQNGRLSLVRYATSLGASDIHRALGAEGLEMKAKLAVEHGHAGGNLYAAVGSGCAGGQGNSAVHPDHIGGEGVLTRSALWSRRRRFSVQTISEASSLCLPRLRPMRPFLLRRGFVAPISLLTSSLQLRHFL
jgi:hypothetical protein